MHNTNTTTTQQFVSLDAHYGHRYVEKQIITHKLRAIDTVVKHGSSALLSPHIMHFHSEH